MIEIIGALYVVDYDEQRMEIIQQMKCEEYIKDEHVKSQLFLIKKMKEGLPPDYPFPCEYTVDDIKVAQTALENYKINHPEYMGYRIIINDTFVLEFDTKEKRDRVFQSCISNIEFLLKSAVKLNEDEPV